MNKSEEIKLKKENRTKIKRTKIKTFSNRGTVIHLYRKTYQGISPKNVPLIKK